MRYFAVGILVWLLLSAKCEEEPLPNVNNNGNAQLRTVEVTVKHIYQVQPTRLDSLVPKVEIKLYLSEYDREHDLNPDGIQTTDTSGVATFEARDDDYYYLRSEHPVLGVENDEVKTPAGTVSFVEIWYY